MSTPGPNDPAEPTPVPQEALVLMDDAPSPPGPDGGDGGVLALTAPVPAESEGSSVPSVTSSTVEAVRIVRAIDEAARSETGPPGGQLESALVPMTRSSDGQGRGTEATTPEGNTTSNPTGVVAFGPPRPAPLALRPGGMTGIPPLAPMRPTSLGPHPLAEIAASGTASSAHEIRMVAVAESGGQTPPAVAVTPEPPAVTENRMVTHAPVSATPRAPVELRPSDGISPMTRTLSGNVGLPFPPGVEPLGQGELALVGDRRLSPGVADVVATHLARWSRAPYQRVRPVDPVYHGRLVMRSCYEFLVRAVETGMHLQQHPSWIREWAAEHCFLPGAVDPSLTEIPLDSLDPRACVALAQSAMEQAGISFVNLVSQWELNPRTQGLLNIQVRTEVSFVMAYLRQELAAWAAAAGGIPFSVRPPGAALQVPARLEGVQIEADGDVMMQLAEIPGSEQVLGRSLVIRLQADAMIAGVAAPQRPQAGPFDAGSLSTVRGDSPVYLRSANSSDQSMRESLGDDAAQLQLVPASGVDMSMSSAFSRHSLNRPIDSGGPGAAVWMVQTGGGAGGAFSGVAQMPPAVFVPATPAQDPVYQSLGPGGDATYAGGQSAPMGQSPPEQTWTAPSRPQWQPTPQREHPPETGGVNPAYRQDMANNAGPAGGVGGPPNWNLAWYDPPQMWTQPSLTPQQRPVATQWPSQPRQHPAEQMPWPGQPSTMDPIPTTTSTTQPAAPRWTVQGPAPVAHAGATSWNQEEPMWSVSTSSRPSLAPMMQPAYETTMPLHASPPEQCAWPATPSVAAYTPRDVAATSAQAPMPQVREREPAMPLRAQTEPFPVTTVTQSDYTVSTTAAHMRVYDVVAPGAHPGYGPAPASGPVPMGASQVITPMAHPGYGPAPASGPVPMGASQVITPMAQPGYGPAPASGPVPVGASQVITPMAHPGYGPTPARGPVSVGTSQVYTSGYRYPDAQVQGRSATGAPAAPLRPSADVAVQPLQGYTPGVNPSGYPYGNGGRSAQPIRTVGDGTYPHPEAQSRWGTTATTGMAPLRPSERVEVQQVQKRATGVYPDSQGFEDDGRRQFHSREVEGRSQLRPSRRAPDPSDRYDSVTTAQRDEAPIAPSPAGAAARNLIDSFRPFIDFATFPTFDGTSNLQDRKVWFEKFKITAESAGWTGLARCQRLKLSLAKKALSWVNQLSRNDHGNWRSLERKFVDKFCRSRNSGMEYYHSLSQGQGEEAVAYLWRLNGAAIRAGISIDSQKALATHVTRFIRTLSDDRARRTLEGRTFCDVRELEETLE
ncbi:hypothetical protein BBJ28_00023769, partial [Nothophytophthora sp. Chile5]